VFLLHQMPPDSGRVDHWDLMFENRDALVTFASPALLNENSEFKVDHLADHRLAYLDYEGPISGGRGAVNRLDQGRFEVESQTSKELILQIFGQKFCGALTISADSETSGSKFLATWMPKLTST